MLVYIWAMPIVPALERLKQDDKNHSGLCSDILLLQRVQHISMNIKVIGSLTGVTMAFWSDFVAEYCRKTNWEGLLYFLKVKF